MSTLRQQLGAAFVLLGVAVGAGCSGLSDHRASFNRLLAQGSYAEAAQELDQPAVKDLYGSRSGLLWLLDRGTLALTIGEPDRAVELLNQAEAWIDESREKSTADVLGSWVINDTTSTYHAAAYEEQYLNVIKMLAHLEAGRINGGASVEVRRMAQKADLLRDRYLEMDTVVRKEADKAGVDPDANGVELKARTDHFVESPLGAFLTAITYCKDQRPELQVVAGRRLVSMIEAERELIGPVEPGPFEGLGEAGPETFNVLIVALVGRGPTKYPETRYYPGPYVPIRIELPMLDPGGTAVTGVSVEVAGAEPVAMHVVEDVGQVARANYEQELHAAYVRTVIRAIAKMGAATAGAVVVANSGDDHDWLALPILIGGALVTGATENADVRAWASLPYRVFVATASLPPGEHSLRLVYRDAGGGVVHESTISPVVVGPGRWALTTLLDRQPK